MPKSRNKRHKTTESSPFSSSSSGTGGNRAWGGIAIALILIAGGAVAWWMASGDKDQGISSTVTVPTNLSARAEYGQKAFNQACASCHGDNAGGGGGGPPLIHKIYAPGHHADGAIRNAVMMGVRQHHWTFGNMPPQKDVSGADIDAITAFLRETQHANGIR